MHCLPRSCRLIFLSMMAFGGAAICLANSVAATPSNAAQTQLVASVGFRFSVSVPSQPVSGHYTQIIGALDNSILDFQSKIYMSQSDPSVPTFQSEGIDTYVFSALSPGTTTINIGNFPPTPYSPVNEAAMPINVRSFIVQVRCDYADCQNGKGIQGMHETVQK
jgi:hypothetical protein